MAANDFRTMTAADLTGMGKDERGLVLEAMEAGCTGRFNASGGVIIRNSANDTATVYGRSRPGNRAWQNSVSSVRRLVEAEKSHRAATEEAPEPTRLSGTTTVASAMVQHGAVFTSWMDSLGHGLPADAKVAVSGTEAEPVFSLVDAPAPQGTAPAAPAGPGQDRTDEQAGELAGEQADGTAEAAEAAPEPAPRTCPYCGNSFGTHTGLIGHLNTHRRVVLTDTSGALIARTSVRELAELNGTSVIDMHELLAVVLKEVGADPGAGQLLVPEAQALDAGLKLPVRPEPDAAAPTEAAEQAEQAADDEHLKDPMLTLSLIRALVGPDPAKDARIAELEEELAAGQSRVAELETQLSKVSDELEESRSRLRSIQQALGS